jgi:hypothetical protein
MISAAFACRSGKGLSGPQPTFELQCGGTTNLTSVKTTRKLVSAALEVRMIMLLVVMCVSYQISVIEQSERSLNTNQLLNLLFV